MDLAAKQSLVKTLAVSYRQADRKTKKQLLDQLVLATGYHRTYRPATPLVFFGRLRRSPLGFLKPCRGNLPSCPLPHQHFVNISI